MQSGGKRSEHYTERGSPIGDMQTGGQAGRQTDKEKLFERGLLFWFLASEADCTVLLYVDRLTSLLPPPSHSPALLFSPGFPSSAAGAHGERGMRVSVSVSAYVDVQLIEGGG